MKHILFLLPVIFLFFITDLTADVGEGELARYRSEFISRIIADNPGREDDIRRCLDYMVKDGNVGSRLIDRFGLFLYDSSRNSLALEKIRFFKDSGNTIFFILLKDSSDGELYSLYLEYGFSGSNNLKLRSTYFSMIYGDRIQSVTRFFGGE